jgi:hypothetical protein
VVETVPLLDSSPSLVWVSEAIRLAVRIDLRSKLDALRC